MKGTVDMIGRDYGFTMRLQANLSSVILSLIVNIINKLYNVCNVGHKINEILIQGKISLQLQNIGNKYSFYIFLFKEIKNLITLKKLQLIINDVERISPGKSRTSIMPTNLESLQVRLGLIESQS